MNSKISHYIKLLPQIWTNKEAIIEGWLNNIKLEKGDLPQDEIDEIIRRRVICSTCPFNSVNAQKSKEYKNIFGEHYKPDETTLHCSVCKCVIDYKTASLTSECGLASNDKTLNMELKWTKYKDNETTTN